HIDGLSEDRRPVFAGGVAVMLAIFRALDIDFMRISDGSLREGVLHDLIGRVMYQDRRATTVTELMKRHHIDFKQAERVRDTTLSLFDQVAPEYALLPRERRLLGWAALLHEIGLMVAHSQYHRHGAYLLENMDLAGFSRQEQVAIATIVRLHRKRYHPEMVEDSVYVRSGALSLMIRLIRIAVLFNRGRVTIDLPPIRITLAQGEDMSLEIGKTWLETHPLTTADLEQEAEVLNSVGYELVLLPI
ncbi:MAG: exopolyphosphatase, partial [Pseudomonadota bacterium]